MSKIEYSLPKVRDTESDPLNMPIIVKVLKKPSFISFNANKRIITIFPNEKSNVGIY